MMISHAEAQELHLCIAAAMLPIETPEGQAEHDELMRRALEIAALVVCDTDPEGDES